MPIITPETEEEFRKVLAEIKGPVAVEFVATDCDYCEAEIPKIDKLVNECANVTVLRADADKLSALADKFLGEYGGTPTIYYSEKPEELAAVENPEGAEKFELKDSSALRRRLKCARKPKAT